MEAKNLLSPSPLGRPGTQVSSVIYSYFIDSAFTAVKRNAELTKYVKG